MKKFFGIFILNLKIEENQSNILKKKKNNKIVYKAVDRKP